MRIIRKLVPGDAGEIEQHFLGLGRDDRRLRFCGATADSCIVQHCASIDLTRSLLLGCFVEGALVAVLSFWPDLDPREAEAEFAISVDRAQQNRGIGREMMQRALILAEN